MLPSLLNETYSPIHLSNLSNSTHNGIIVHDDDSVNLVNLHHSHHSIPDLNETEPFINLSEDSHENEDQDILIKEPNSIINDHFKFNHDDEHQNESELPYKPIKRKKTTADDEAETESENDSIDDFDNQFQIGNLSDTITEDSIQIQYETLTELSNELTHHHHHSNNHNNNNNNNHNNIINNQHHHLQDQDSQQSHDDDLFSDDSPSMGSNSIQLRQNNASISHLMSMGAVPTRMTYPTGGPVSVSQQPVNGPTTFVPITLLPNAPIIPSRAYLQAGAVSFGPTINGIMGDQLITMHHISPQNLLTTNSTSNSTNQNNGNNGNGELHGIPMSPNNSPGDINIHHHHHSNQITHQHSLEDLDDIPNSPGSDTGSSKSRKVRWRPSRDQRQILEQFWLENQYPDQDTKQLIIERLGGEISYKQITSWFKHKRENDKAKGKFSYKYQPALKFTSEQVKILEDVFNQEPYAKGKLLQDLSLQLGVTDKRVQNWFKHKRSRLAQQGKFAYKPRTVLNEDQITFLRGAFCTNQTPTPELFEQISSELNVKPEQVQRWFSSERSKKRRKDDHEGVPQIYKATTAVQPDESPPLPPPKTKRASRRKNTTAAEALPSFVQLNGPIHFATLPPLNMMNAHHLLDGSEHYMVPMGIQEIPNLLESVGVNRVS